jgi:hypothetical protein
MHVIATFDLIPGDIFTGYLWHYDVESDGREVPDYIGDSGYESYVFQFALCFVMYLFFY